MEGVDEDAAMKACCCCPLWIKLCKWWRRRRNQRRQRRVRQQAKDHDAKNTDEHTGDTSEGKTVALPATCKPEEVVWHSPADEGIGNTSDGDETVALPITCKSEETVCHLPADDAERCKEEIEPRTVIEEGNHNTVALLPPDDAANESLAEENVNRKEEFTLPPAEKTKNPGEEEKVDALSLPEEGTAANTREQVAAQTGTFNAPERHCQRQVEGRCHRLKKDPKFMVTLSLAVNMRRHVVGTGGKTLWELHQKFGGVRITVPPPQDQTEGILLEGPASQVTAAAEAIRACVHEAAEAEARLLEERTAIKARKNRVIVRVSVSLKMRRHVIGAGGEVLRALHQEYEAVQITVPPPFDKETEHVTLAGPKKQVVAAAAKITKRLEEAEVWLREKREARQALVRLTIPVPPNCRRQLIGAQGEALRSILQHHEGVRVCVPPPQDHHTCHVTLHGPNHHVEAVAAQIKRRLQEVDAHMRARHASTK